MSNFVTCEKTLGCWWFICGDDNMGIILPSYVGIINHYKDPGSLWQNQYNGKLTDGSLWYVLFTTNQPTELTNHQPTHWDPMGKLTFWSWRITQVKRKNIFQHIPKTSQSTIYPSNGWNHQLVTWNLKITHLKRKNLFQIFMTLGSSR